MNLSKLVFSVVACVAVTTLSLSGCVSAQSPQSPQQPPVLAPVGAPACGAFEDDYLAFLVACGVTAVPIEALSEEMGLQFYAPNIELIENDPDLFAAAAFGNKCLVQIRYSGEGIIDDDGVVQQYYDALLMKRKVDGFMVFVTDDPAPPADIVVALQAYESECA